MYSSIREKPLLAGALFFLCWLVAGLLPASAVHLIGGEMTYRVLDTNGSVERPWRYEITARIYVNPVTDQGDKVITAMIYPYNSITYPPTQTLRLTRVSITPLSLPALPGCSPTTAQVALALYVATVELPAYSNGFTVSCPLNDRVEGITNLAYKTQVKMGLGVDMAPATLPNSSPVFSNIPLSQICLGTSTFVANNAYDADGDELVYKLSPPYTNYAQPYPSPVFYATGFSANEPFGSTGSATVDPATGLSRYLGSAQGFYQLAVDVQEFRVVNGQRKLLSTVHRDIQVIVRQCATPPGQLPYFTPASVAQRDFQISAGQPLTFDVTAVDPDGHNLTLTASSALLDGPNGIDATFGNSVGTSVSANPAGQVSIKGTGTVTGSFRLNGCVPDRNTPYEVLVTATDETCNSQTIVATFKVMVIRPSLTATIQGQTILCGQSLATYTVSSTPAYAAYQWTVQGGELLAPTSSTKATVLWGKQGGGVVSVAGISPTGCPTKSVSFPVVIVPGQPLLGPSVYCPGANTGLRYFIPGTAMAYQWTLTNGTIKSGEGTNEVIVDVASGATAILQATLLNSSTCSATVRIAPDETCLAFFNVITPNGDNKNEVFAIKNIERYPNTGLTIFDRWGKQVYHSNDYQNTYTGDNTGAGVHYYRCVLADGTVYKGWFEIIR